jgi:CRP-like cAMP-binding protein
MPNAYFPTQGCISMLARTEGHRGVEVCMVGREGMVGAPIVLGVASAPFQALVQSTGESLRIDSGSLREEIARNPMLLQLLQRYVSVQMAQTAISAGCLRFHLLGPRLARWLLMAQDRAQADRFRVTQDVLADMLGVRRAGVSAAAAALQQRGLIHYRRGNFSVVDRRGLLAMACSCYAAGKRCHDEVMGP